MLVRAWQPFRDHAYGPALEQGPYPIRKRRFGLFLYVFHARILACPRAIGKRKIRKFSEILEIPLDIAQMCVYSPPGSAGEAPQLNRHGKHVRNCRWGMIYWRLTRLDALGAARCALMQAGAVKGHIFFRVGHTH
jgi:hypothetical protein